MAPWEYIVSCRRIPYLVRLFGPYDCNCTFCRVHSRTLLWAQGCIHRHIQCSRMQYRAVSKIVMMLWHIVVHACAMRNTHDLLRTLGHLGGSALHRVDNCHGDLHRARDHDVLYDGPCSGLQIFPVIAAGLLAVAAREILVHTGVKRATLFPPTYHIRLSFSLSGLWTYTVLYHP